MKLDEIFGADILVFLGCACCQLLGFFYLAFRYALDIRNKKNDTQQGTTRNCF